MQTKIGLVKYVCLDHVTLCIERRNGTRTLHGLLATSRQRTEMEEIEGFSVIEESWP
jgi:hypothetical protein